MIFVGRRAETRVIQQALAHGENVILSGRYGVGRTRLVRHVAEISAPSLKFAFADFTDPAAHVARELWMQLAHKSKAAAESLSFTGVVGRLAAIARERRNAVVVLDNIAKLTMPKVRFIQKLTLLGQMRYIAIVEPFLPEAHFTRLKGCLAPSVRLDLKNLPISEVCRYFEAVSAKYGRDWDAGMIEGMAAATGGYALAMTQMAERELTR